ncbi:hypothetical protein GGR54DRAFT_248279 [Hypoxylon sp. NC1633]|nr:hypothetical protein GGR54DRAFT_248279 [Hypoxylon sp. NC1633]
MAATYDVQTYLLDKANIETTVNRLTINVDLEEWDNLISQVYAPEVVIDFTSLSGGKPHVTTNEAWVKGLLRKMKGFDSAQHIVTNLVIELPQPIKGARRPNKCIVHAQVNGHMFRRAAKGGPMIHNGGRYVLELVRLPELEEKGENPWRVSKQAIFVVWDAGNTDVMSEYARL